MNDPLHPNAHVATDAEVDAIYDRVFLTDLNLPRWMTRQLVGIFLTMARNGRKNNAPPETIRAVFDFLFDGMKCIVTMTDSEAESWAAIKVRLIDAVNEVD